eukprot:2968535-Rhodomonas_salina.1
MYETHSTAKWTYLIILAVVERENRRVINGDLMHKESWSAGFPKPIATPQGKLPITSEAPSSSIGQDKRKKEREKVYRAS